MSPLRIGVVCCALACMGATDPLQVRLPELDVMPGMEASWVAEKMAMNGVPMSIKTFESQRSATKVLDYYERKWAKAGQRSRRDDFGEYKTLGTGRGDYYYSLQVRDHAGGSEGRLTVTKQIDDARQDTEFPLPRRTELVSIIDSLDAGTRAESIVAYAPGDALRNADWLTRELGNAGWAADPFVRSPPGPEKVLGFQRNAELCQVTLLPNQPGKRGKTMLLIHWVK